MTCPLKANPDEHTRFILEHLLVQACFCECLMTVVIVFCLHAYRVYNFVLYYTIYSFVMYILIT